MNCCRSFPRSHPRIGCQTRRGTSLIETIVTLSVASTLFLLATAWIHQSFFVASKMRDQGRHHDNLMRLSRQFRDDVHSATSAEVVDDTQLRMAAPTGSILYEVAENRISRSFYRDGDTSLAAQETYGLLRGSDIRWELNDRWLNLTVARTRGHRPSTPKTKTQSFEGPTRPSDLHVRARVGRWLDQMRVAEASQ